MQSIMSLARESNGSTFVSQLETIERVKNKYFQLKTKTRLRRIDIYFLRQCMKYNLTPEFINIKMNMDNQRARDAWETARTKWI